MFGVSRWFWLTFVCLAMTGATDTISMIIRNIVRQLETPDRLRGRMIGVNMVFFQGGPQLGELEAGAVANWLGPVVSVVSGGLGCVIATAWVAARDAGAAALQHRSLFIMKHQSGARSQTRAAVALVAAFVFICVTAGSAGARQEGGQPDAPRLNQPGKDVQWVPTPPALVEKMLDLARLTPKDRLVDLGSGDGVLVIAAARRGARARGIEYDRGLVEFSKRKAAEAGVSQLTRFVRGDIFKTDFSDATVVTTFLLPSMNLRLRPTFLAMKPGTRIVANTFAIADWQPDESVAIEPCERWCTALLWIVPAHVGGTWSTPKGDLTLTQKFQMVSGTLGKEPIENGRLRGDEISFTVGEATYTGRVEENRMQVSATVDGRRSSGRRWRCRRRRARRC